ncbi:MAG: M24 family metallopeptidase [Dongiaceae bacterium]
MVTNFFPQAEYEARWQKVEEGLKRRNLDAAVVWGRSGGNFERSGDVLYLTNYYGTGSGQGLDTPITTARAFASVLVQRGQKPELMSDDHDPDARRLATDRISWSRNTIQSTAEMVKKRGLKGRVGLVGSDFFPMKYWDMFKAATPQVEWQVEDDLIRDVRLIKSDRELEAIRMGGEIVTRALDKLLQGLIMGKKESEAAADAAYEVVKGGGHVHMIPVSHGKLIHYFTRDPLNGYSHDTPVEGDLVRGWVYGPMVEGYWLDPGRTAVCGKRATNAQKHLVESCAGIVDKLIQRIKPGMALADLAKYGDELVKEFGGEKDQAAEKFPLYGHGLGLFFEKPYISTLMGEPGTTFKENMVFGVEAFLASAGVGSAGYEDNVIITKNGAERVTKTPPVMW